MKKYIFIIFFTLFFFFLYGIDKKINLKEGMSKLIKSSDVTKIEIDKKEIISATILSDKEVIVEGKKSGESLLKIYTKSGEENYFIVVKSKSKSESMIQIDVQMLEIINSNGGDFGINWAMLLKGTENKDMPVSPLNLKEQEPSLLAFGKFERGAINAMLDFLVKNNYAKLLAKPKLLACNGQKAEFLSGGEVPVVLTDTQGKISVDWKKYGINLEIKSEVLKNNNIKSELRAEVSNLDYANAIKIGLSGGVMPAIKTRWAKTTIILENDETIIIAGLIQDEEAKVVYGVPVLSAIPLIGELFKSTGIENRKTELVIFVTPKIIGEQEI